jgi:hypothetical protein
MSCSLACTVHLRPPLGYARQCGDDLQGETQAEPRGTS